MIDLNKVKKLREETGAGVMDAKKSLEESGGDFEKAKRYLRKKGVQKAEKKSNRATKSGKVFAYVHSNGAVGSMVKIGCETDFVARNEEFVKLGNEIAMQVAAMSPKDVSELLDQDYIRDPKRKVKDLVTEVISRTGENIEVIEISQLKF